MANFTDNLKEKLKALSPTKVGEYIQESQIYRSIFRVGVPDSDRKRMLVMLGSVFFICIQCAFASPAFACVTRGAWAESRFFCFWF
jgi:hypothetical protein